jgi:hypothetical protein
VEIYSSSLRRERFCRFEKWQTDIVSLIWLLKNFCDYASGSGTPVRVEQKELCDAKMTSIHTLGT